MARKRYKKRGIDWQGHMIDIVKYLVPIIIMGSLGLWLTVGKLETKIEGNKEFYAAKFDQTEKGQNNLANWMKAISDKLDRHLEKDTDKK